MNTQNSSQLLVEVFKKEIDFSEPLKNEKLKLFLKYPFQLNSYYYPYGEYGLFVNKDNIEDFKVLHNKDFKTITPDFIYIPFPEEMLEKSNFKQALKAILLKGFYFKGNLINFTRVNFEEFSYLFFNNSLDKDYQRHLSSLYYNFLDNEVSYLTGVRFSFVLSVLANS